MAPNDVKKIPEWQWATSLPGAEDIKVTAESPPQEAEEQESTHEASRKEEDKSKDDIDGLKEQVFKFLNDPSIKDASRERKAAFLESKGLKKEEIDLLLSTPDAQASAKPASSPPTLQAPRNVPPVITYPEFLVHSQKPPPLVTKTLILNAAYVTAGIYGTLYALSKYIVNPMQEQLWESRHDFLTHSTEKLQTFNEKLSEIVSKIPEANTAKKEKDVPNDDEDSDDGDPTELYHRDFGTQTTPALSRRPSSASESSSSSPSNPTSSQESTLKSIISSLESLSTRPDSAETDISNQLSPLITKLNEMAYTSSAYHKYSVTGSYSWAGNEGNVGKEDEIERLVKDIKSLKGQFLGVKNFPRAGVR